MQAIEISAHPESVGWGDIVYQLAIKSLLVILCDQTLRQHYGINPYMATEEGNPCGPD